MATEFDQETARRPDPAPPVMPPQPTADATAILAEKYAAQEDKGDAGRLDPSLTANNPTIRRSNSGHMSSGAMVGIVCLAIVAVAVLVSVLT